MSFAQCSQEEQPLTPLPKRWSLLSLDFSLALPGNTERTARELKSHRSFSALFILREVEGAGLLLSLAMASSKALSNGCLPYCSLTPFLQDLVTESLSGKQHFQVPATVEGNVE